MMNKTHPLILACATTLFASYSSASFFDSHDGQFDLGHHIAENAYGFLPVPILITEPAVGVGGGVVRGKAVLNLRLSKLNLSELRDMEHKL